MRNLWTPVCQVHVNKRFLSAGDHVKFNLPLSQSVHALVYGFERFMDGYDALGKKDEMFDMLKWPLDYFMKCWIPDQQIYYFQVVIYATH